MPIYCRYINIRNTYLGNRGIYYWNEDIRILNEIKKLKLNKFMMERNEILIRYCHLRIQTYNILYKKVNEASNKYDGEIDEYNLKIKKIQNSLTVL